MKAIPLGWREAVAFVNGTHRHHKSPQGWRFGIGAVKSGELVGVVMVGRPEELVIEMIASYGMPVGKEVFETCVWIGRFIQAHSSKYRLVYRADVKMHLCHSMKANDATIRQALIDRFGAPGTKKNPGLLYGMNNSDIRSAFAVGLTAIETPRKEST